MTAASGKRLGRVLVQSGLITQEQLDVALAEASGRSLCAILVDQQITDEVSFARSVAESMGLAFVDLGAIDIDPNAATMVSVDIARRHSVLPIRVQDDELIVAMADPANIFAIDDLRIVFDPLLKPLPEPTTSTDGTTTSPTTPSTTDTATPYAQGVLYLDGVETVDGVMKAVLRYNGQTYTLAPGEGIPGTPWEVFSVSSGSVTMLYGDNRITLVVGQGITK